MTHKNHLITDNEEKAHLAIAAKFSDLERLHQFGNKMALYDAVALSNKLQVGLPEWAVKSVQKTVFDEWSGRLTVWKGEKVAQKGHKASLDMIDADFWNEINALRDVGYLALLKTYVRAKVFKHAMAWAEDINKYDLQPMRTIDLWFEGEISQPKNAEDALKITEEGLVGTYAHCGTVTLKDYIYTDHLSAINKFISHDPETANALGITPKNLIEHTKSQIRDHHGIPFEFGYNDTEVAFGLRPAGRFWGPSCEPPEHIQMQLSPPPAPFDVSTGEDF